LALPSPALPHLVASNIFFPHPDLPLSQSFSEMHVYFLVVTAILATTSTALPASPTATDVLDVYAAQATAKTESPTSHVKGKVFDRYVSIWFENTDYDMAAADRELSQQR
jgi:hypothetical protein